LPAVSLLAMTLLLIALPAAAQQAQPLIIHAAAESTRATDPYHDHWLGRDKAAHFALSCAIIGFGYHLGHTQNGNGQNGTRNATIGISLSLGAAKELWDSTKKGNHFSLKDLAADIAGTACGALLFTRK
jgi:putative lipoprotein